MVLKKKSCSFEEHFGHLSWIWSFLWFSVCVFSSGSCIFRKLSQHPLCFGRTQRTRWPASIQHRRNWEMLFYCFVVWFLLSGVVAAFCIFNLYLFPGGSLRAMVSVSGTHWSHSHLEAAVQPQSGLLASEQLGAVRVNALLKGTSEVVMRAVFHFPYPRCILLVRGCEHGASVAQS